MPMGGLALTRQDWVEVCRVLHAADVRTPRFSQGGALFPDMGSRGPSILRDIYNETVRRANLVNSGKWRQ
jgi:hypothetical protein